MPAVPLTDAQKSAIADVAIASAELEAEVVRCIIDLCKVWPGHGRVLLSNIRLEAKLNMLRQLIEVEFPDSDVLAEFSAVLDDLKSLTADRNTIIHGDWIPLHWTLDPKGSGFKRAKAAGSEVVARRVSGKRSNIVSASKTARIAKLMTLNHALLRQVFWERFRERVSGLSGLPALPETPSSQLRLKIQKLGRSNR